MGRLWGFCKGNRSRPNVVTRTTYELGDGTSLASPAGLTFAPCVPCKRCTEADQQWTRTQLRRPDYVCRQCEARPPTSNSSLASTVGEGHSCSQDPRSDRAGSIDAPLMAGGDCQRFGSPPFGRRLVNWGSSV